jgi:asparagine synthase (glutamine-hydrolysing)
MNLYKEKISSLHFLTENECFFQEADYGEQRMNDSIKWIAQEILQKLTNLVLHPPLADGILFSGGLDSAVLACINPGMKAITITLESHGPDIEYARNISKSKDIPHYHREISVDDALHAIPEVIKILGSFDPALPNDLTVYFGMKYAKELGLRSIITGDGSDEIFAGYSYMETIDNLENYIKRLAPYIRFSSNTIGEHFGITIHQPFLQKDFLNFALSIDPELKIKKVNHKTWGKWILRHSFSDILPDKIAWQSKRPLEVGSGMTQLRAIIESKVSDKEFAEKSRLYGVNFFNKEHLYYYEIFLREVGPVPRPKNDERECPGCGTGIMKGKSHCRVCGWSEAIL